MKRLRAVTTILVALCALSGCTVTVVLPPVAFSSAQEADLTDGFAVMLVDLSTNAEFMRYQDRFRGLNSGSLSVRASNSGAAEQTLRIYGSQDGALDRDTVAASATLLAVFPVPAGAQSQQVTQQLGPAALTFLENALKESPPVFTIYTRSDDASPEGLTYGALTFVPGQSEFSALRLRPVPGGEAEVDFRS